jgi:hypothetical protein
VDWLNPCPWRANLPPALKIKYRSGGRNELEHTAEIKRSIAALTPLQLTELYAWLDQYHPQPIDARVQTDLAATRLDNAIACALDDEKNGRVQL